MAFVIISPETNLSQKGGDAVVSVWLFSHLYFYMINAANISCSFGSLDQAEFKNK